MEKPSRKVIVTGGCGYIGSHVARALKMRGDDCEVIIVDRVLREHTLKDIDGFLQADFASDEALALIADTQPDAIVHCAGTSLVGPSMLDPGEYYDNNVAKTIRMMNVLKDMPKKPIIVFSSSASVYGEPKSLPIHEGADINPLSPYGSTKAMVERVLQDYHSAYGIPSVCFRYFNAAGAEPINFDLGQEPHATHLVARILEAKLNNVPFTLNGDDYDTDDGSCIRDYIHVWDLAIAHVRAIDYMVESLNNGFNGAAIFNLGTGKGISNWQIINYVRETYGDFPVVISNRRAGDPNELVADAEMAERVMGWTPQYSDLQTIVDSAYKWYCKNV